MWSRRIAEWRSNGLTAQEFSESRGYSAAGLYAWSSRLGRSAEAASNTPVRIARVVQLRSAELPPVAEIATSEVPVVVEMRRCPSCRWRWGPAVHPQAGARRPAQAVAW